MIVASAVGLTGRFGAYSQGVWPPWAIIPTLAGLVGVFLLLRFLMRRRNARYLARLEKDREAFERFQRGE